jgi:hypothetical protein
MELTDKIYFSFYLKENIILFDVYEYIDKLGSDVVDYFDEWNLIKNKKIIFKKQIIDSFIENKIKSDFESVLIISKKINCKILCFYSNKKFKNKWVFYFEDIEKFLKIVIKKCKSTLPNFVQKQVNFTFSHKKGCFFDIPCLILSGEEEEFLQKILKKTLDF